MFSLSSEFILSYFFCYNGSLAILFLTFCQILLPIFHIRFIFRVLGPTLVTFWPPRGWGWERGGNALGGLKLPECTPNPFTKKLWHNFSLSFRCEHTNASHGMGSTDMRVTNMISKLINIWFPYLATWYNKWYKIHENRILHSQYIAHFDNFANTEATWSCYYINFPSRHETL